MPGAIPGTERSSFRSTKKLKKQTQLPICEWSYETVYVGVCAESRGAEGVCRGLQGYGCTSNAAGGGHHQHEGATTTKKTVFLSIVAGCGGVGPRLLIVRQRCCSTVAGSCAACLLCSTLSVCVCVEGGRDSNAKTEDEGWWTERSGRGERVLTTQSTGLMPQARSAEQ